MAAATASHDALAPPMATLAQQETPISTLTKADMLRTHSMNIREEREDLKKAAEQSMNAILELNLDGTVRWLSPSWQDVTGKSGSDLLGKNIAEITLGDEDVFASCVEAMRKDDSKSRIARFSVAAPARSDDADWNSADDATPLEAKLPELTLPEPVQELDFVPAVPVDQQPTATVNLEAQGIMVYDRETGKESYTMWMVKPAISREITIDLPDLLVESLGIGAELLAKYLTLLADVGSSEPDKYPPPLPVLCRICERHIPPWWFEKHTELCAQDHRAEMEVQMAQESLNEHRSALVKVLDALEAVSGATKIPPGDTGASAHLPKAEYKGHTIGSQSNPSSGLSSGRSSPAPHVSRSRDSSAGGLGHHRARSFAVRRPLARIVELVLDLCDTAMEISTPSVKDPGTCVPGEIRTQSPQSEGHVQQVLQWQSPSASALENERGLALLCDDTSQLAKNKVEAVFRHRRILEYSERIRIEYEVLVAECIDAAVQKAEQLRAGDFSDSAESSAESTQDGTSEQQLIEARDDTLRVPVDYTRSHADTFATSSPRIIPHPASMGRALRSVSEMSLDRRVSSGGSSRNSSPHGAATPRSYAGHTDPAVFQKRMSIAMESDAGNESDSSMHSSIASSSLKRVDSPSAELPLNRVMSTRSRERKRQSLVLPSLSGFPSNRQPSPGRDTGAPTSPIRVNKPRLPSGAMSNADSLPSPITSPILSQSELSSPILRGQARHHRRQSSAVLLHDAFIRPGSPRLSGTFGNAQPRAAQTSIKDFEIIKPISKGAFGSVYLSKKKSTGDYYAIKVLKKADMVAKNQVTNVKAERAIMMWQGESDFVAKLYWTFSSKDFLYLVMEYLNGGDCASLIKVLGALPEDWTKKYIGEMVLCVEHLHTRQIVHRDLKPDNLLIDAKGHLKLTDFGLSRMGLIGRQKRARNAAPEDAPPDLLKKGPFQRAPSVGSSRSASFDFQGFNQSPAQTPAMHPAYGQDVNQPSYFSLNRESSISREPSRRTSGHRSDSGDSDALTAAFRRISIVEGRTPIEEETHADDGGADSPDPYGLQPVQSNSSGPKVEQPPQNSMPPPHMALYDPEDSNRRFVGTPDYLAPETINGAGQDEMSDWWSLGCILFECLYGRPPFNADTPAEVFQHILDRNIQWPDDDEDDLVSEEAKDLVNKLICLDPKDRLGSNKDEKYANGGEEIRAHPWFADVNWQTLREDEASFVPANENPEDTEYFDPRGVSMENISAEFEDQMSSPLHTPGNEYPDRPHDALSRVRTQVNAVKRNLMPLHIPPHVRDGRSRRLSEPIVADDFGNFQFKNLPILEKANKDLIQKLRADTMHAQVKTATAHIPPASGVSASPAPSLEASPVLPMPLKHSLSNRSKHRSHSPSVTSQTESSPSRGSHPSSPLLVQFSTGNHERRKTSGGLSHLSQHMVHANSLPSGDFFDQASRLPGPSRLSSNTPSPVKGPRPISAHMSISGDQTATQQRQSSVPSPRQRSHTVGSQDGDLVPELIPAHHKRRSGVFDVSPSSSDNEETRQKALLRVHRRRASSRRLSQVNIADGPSFRTLDVLVCEDHPVSRLVMERQLEKLRCRTISVTNGSEALRYALGEVQFDIIMMEYKLPHLNGADVARMIRDTKNSNTNTPIVAVTGYLKELQAPHYFDALVEKPPTKEKLEEVMARLCQWKVAPEGWKPSLAKPIAPSGLRRESGPRDDSPTTTTTSSGFSGFGAAMSSTRGDSIGSSQMSSTGDTDSQYDSIPVIISRSATNDWENYDLERNFGALGISGTISAEPNPDKNMPGPPSLIKEVSAPAALGIPDWTPTYKQQSTEDPDGKSRSRDGLRPDHAADQGDDEDEELGMFRVRTRSPRRNIKRSSKLGTEMMRTNSQGSVVSGEESVDPDAGAMEAVLSDEPIVEESAAELEAEGKITPPVKFPPLPGNQSEIIDMNAELDPNATPRPHGHETDPDPTPRASMTPAHTD